jgi:transmembrane sensor
MSEAPLQQETIDTAIDWMVRLKFSVADAQTRQGFEHWLQAHPDHARAWRRLDTMNNEFSRLPPTLSRSTLQGRFSRRDSLKLLALSAVGCGAVWLAGNRLASSPWMADRRSGVGERLAVNGPLGSRIFLNTESAVDMRPPVGIGALVLQQGEIIVDVGAGDSGPVTQALEVRSRDGYLQTRDARFLLREKSQAMALSVQRGVVTVFLGHQPGVSPLTVSAGQHLLFTANSIDSGVDNGIDPWGWSDGVLSAHKARLGDVVTELSRYRRGILRCTEDVADLRVSGSFQLADTDQVLALLANALPLRVDYRTRYWATISHS